MLTDDEIEKGDPLDEYCGGGLADYGKGVDLPLALALLELGCSVASWPSCAGASAALSRTVPPVLCGRARLCAVQCRPLPQ